MTWKKSVLVVANVTSTSDEFLGTLKSRAAGGPVSFTLVVPATPFGGGHAAAERKLAEAITALRDAGLQADGEVGPPDPLVAVTDVWDPKRFDEIIVSTLPMKFSKWLHAGLPERIAKLTDAPVTHVVSQPPRPAVVTEPVPRHDSPELGPLAVLGWGGAKK